MRILTLCLIGLLLATLTACTRNKSMTPAEIRRSLAGGCFQSNMESGGLTADRVRAYCECYARELTERIPADELMAMNDNPAAVKNNSLLEESRNKCLMEHLIPGQR